MRPILLLAVAAYVPLSARRRLQIVQPIISQIDGGVADAARLPHTYRARSCSSPAASPISPRPPEEKMHLAYSVQAFDPKGVPLTEIYKNELDR